MDNISGISSLTRCCQKWRSWWNVTSPTCCGPMVIGKQVQNISGQENFLLGFTMRVHPKISSSQMTGIITFIILNLLIWDQPWSYLNCRWGIGCGMTHGGFWSGPDRWSPGIIIHELFFVGSYMHAMMILIQAFWSIINGRMPWRLIKNHGAVGKILFSKISWTRRLALFLSSTNQ